MADVATLIAAVKALRLPVRRLTPEEMAAKIKANLGDDKFFKGAIRDLAAPRAYTASQLVQIYNAVLDRQERFARSATKKAILSQLAEEREIMISNDNARAVIAAHSKPKK